MMWLTVLDLLSGVCVRSPRSLFECVLRFDSSLVFSSRVTWLTKDTVWFSVLIAG